MAHCDNCGEHVSDRFARVFRDADGQLRACPSCAANIGIEQVARTRSSDTKTP